MSETETSTPRVNVTELRRSETFTEFTTALIEVQKVIENPGKDQTAEVRGESKSGKEVWSRQEKHCDNVYFDITPRQLITGFVSEAGILDAAGMREHVQRWQRLAKDLAL